MVVRGDRGVRLWGRSAVSRETSRVRIAAYEALLTSWSGTINLLSKRDRGAAFLQHHIEDCLALVDHLPAGLKRFVDVGSGSGLPAIPIVIATGLAVDLVEADLRKAAFLQTAVAALSLSATVWRDRVETTCAPAAECLTARALAPLDQLLTLSAHLLTPTGTALFLKGPRAAEEVELALFNWHMTIDLLPGATSRSTIVKITNLRRIGV